MMKFLKNIVNKLNTYIKTLILIPRNFVLGGGATTTTSENETCTELTMRLLFPEELNNANEDQSGGGLSTNPFEENPYTEHKESDTTDLIDFYERVEKDNLEYSKTMIALSKKADEILESINEHNDKSKAITKNIVEEKTKYDNILDDLSKFYEKVYGAFDKIVIVISAIILLVIIINKTIFCLFNDETYWTHWWNVKTIIKCFRSAKCLNNFVNKYGRGFVSRKFI